MFAKLSVEADGGGSGDSAMPIPDRRVLERDMAKAFGLDEDMTTEEAEADTLFCTAMDATNAKARRKILKAALVKDPRHIDAIVELAQLSDDSDAAFLLLSQAIEFGKEDLEEELRDDVGHFWGMHHTRPFMRAKQAIAEWYFETGELADAADEIEEILKLNPNDNQGVRWTLMEVYCRMDRLDDAERLLQEYPDDGMPFLPFTGLLIQLRKEGDSPELRASLQKQADWNPHIIPRLLDPHLIGHESIAMFSPRSPEEADLYCQQFLSVWKATPGAITWLRSAARDLLSSDVEPTGVDVKKEIQKLRTKVKKLDSCAETWFCNAEFISEQEADGWLLTVVEMLDDGMLCLEPGENPLGSETVLYGLFNTMLAPDEGAPRRPAVIEFTDVELHRSLNKRLERLGIVSNLVDERPEVLDFMERSLSIAGQSVEIDINALRETPVSSATWEVDWRQIDQWLPDEETEELVQPWMILVAHQEENLILSQLLLLTPPDSNTLLGVIKQAILSPPVGTPSRPTTIRVPSAEHHLDIKSVADDVGVECVVGHCPLMDQMFESLSQHMEEAFGGPPALISLSDVTPGMVGDFYEVAVDFYKSRVWTSTPPDTVVEVQCSELIHGRWYATIMGQMGQEIGIFFFDNRETLESVFTSDPSDPSVGGKKMCGVAFSLNKQELIHPRDVAAAEQFGWPVVDAETWPMGYFISDGAMRPLDITELQFLSAATRAVTKQLQSREVSLVTSVTLHEQVVQVSTNRE